MTNMKDFTSTITFLQTTDLEKTTEFYTKIMHFPLIVDQGQCRIFKSSNDSFIGFCSHDFLEEKPENVCVTLVCSSKEEVDKWYQYLQEQNVTTKAPPKENKQFKIYNFFAKDPNDILLEIQFFLHAFP
jgi:predicted lactoylglutathione lyase